MHLEIEYERPFPDRDTTVLHVKTPMPATEQFIVEALEAAIQAVRAGRREGLGQ